MILSPFRYPGGKTRLAPKIRAWLSAASRPDSVFVVFKKMRLSARLRYNSRVMLQLTDKTVNVSVVPQRSPLRYPGGKTWLVPRLREWLGARQLALFVEPFAGGGVMSLTAVMEGFAERAVMCERDPELSRLWRMILHSPECLAAKIRSFEPTRDNVVRLLADNGGGELHEAFRTFVRNRVNRGGILAKGATMARAGENGKGVASRWYPDTLAKRIMDIAAVAGRIDFFEGDGLALMRAVNNGRRAAYFIDPPYTAGGKRAGSRLYNCNEIDHAELFRVAAGLRGEFLMTYDDAPEVRMLVAAHGFHVAKIPMKSTHHRKTWELLITRGETFS